MEVRESRKKEKKKGRGGKGSKIERKELKKGKREVMVFRSPGKVFLLIPPRWVSIDDAIFLLRFDKKNTS